MQQLTQATFLMLQKRHFERRIVSKHEIFMVFKDLHAELPGLTMLDVFGHFNDHIRTRLGTYENMIVCMLYQTGPLS